MPRVLIGCDYEGIGSVKVTKDAYDPQSTPDSNIGAFLYNSKTAVDMKVTAVLDPAVMWAGVGTGAHYLPAGANNSNATAACWNYGQYMYSYVRAAYAGETFYDIPFFDMKTFDSSSNRFVQAKMARNTYGTQNRGIEYVYTLGGAWMKDFNGNTFSWWTGTKDTCLALNWNWSSLYTYRRQIAVLWRLPSDQTAVLDGVPQTPTPGQRILEISGNALRVAKPGFDVRTATKTQMAFDASSNPTKVLVAADIAVPVGESYYEVAFSIPAGALADVHFYEGSDIYYPVNPVASISAGLVGTDYWFSGNRIYFANSGVACRARFIVYAFDDAPATSGSYSVIRQFTANGQGVVQFVRPGAGAEPSFADIIVDTRWPALRPIAEGYIPVTANGEQTYEVNIDSSGMLPMVRFVTVHAGQSGGTSYSKVIRTPLVRNVFIDPQGGNVNGGTAGDTCYCRLTPTKATFKTFRGNPTRIYYASGSAAESDQRSYNYDANPIQGIRYYIFGIPQ